jgi:hypothetical protein
MKVADISEPVYARYMAIVQSSGMGKSRMMDETAKLIVLIPVNLRPSTDRGKLAKCRSINMWTC